MTYVPGWEKTTCVVAFPSFTTIVIGSNVNLPGPRQCVQVTASPSLLALTTACDVGRSRVVKSGTPSTTCTLAPPRARGGGAAGIPSSAAEAVSVTVSPTETVRAAGGSIEIVGG